MSYSTNPNLPKARAKALKELIEEEKPLGIVANRNGIHRTTLYCWFLKWKSLNHIELKNYGRPNRPIGKKFKLSGCTWNIPTESSAPKTHPRQISEAIVKRVLELRTQNERCSEIIWHNLRQENIVISLSSINVY